MSGSAQPLFDIYICVDWSASSRPKTGKDSIWIGCYTRRSEGGDLYACYNPPTRLAAQTQLVHLLESAARTNRRALVGFDFALGYPSGTAAALGLDLAERAPWQALHRHLADHCAATADNSNQRFAVASDMNARMSGTPHPFWGTPKQRATPTLSTHKGTFSDSSIVAERRQAEAWVRQTYRAQPKSVWQLLGVGAVGSQALLGIPSVHYLRHQFPRSRIWPFETGWKTLTKETLTDVTCVFAEIYPSLHAVTPKPDEVLDAAQMRCLCHAYKQHDSAGELGALFGPPKTLQTTNIYQIESEEGWILAKKR